MPLQPLYQPFGQDYRAHPTFYCDFLSFREHLKHIRCICTSSFDRHCLVLLPSRYLSDICIFETFRKVPVASNVTYSNLNFSPLVVVLPQMLSFFCSHIIW